MVACLDMGQEARVLSAAGASLLAKGTWMFSHFYLASWSGIWASDRDSNAGLSLDLIQRIFETIRRRGVVFVLPFQSDMAVDGWNFIRAGVSTQPSPPARVVRD
jgi:hypothetical protein